MGYTAFKKQNVNNSSESRNRAGYQSSCGNNLPMRINTETIMTETARKKKSNKTTGPYAGAPPCCLNDLPHSLISFQVRFSTYELTVEIKIFCVLLSLGKSTTLNANVKQEQNCWEQEEGWGALDCYSTVNQSLLLQTEMDRAPDEKMAPRKQDLNTAPPAHA